MKSEGTAPGDSADGGTVPDHTDIAAGDTMAPAESAPRSGPPRAISEPAAGSIVGGRYRLERKLGEGGFGAVYEASHVAIGRRVAVKFLHAEASSRADLRERFLREARAANQTRHPNIVEVLDFGEELGAPYLVMEHLEGAPLDAFLAKEGPLAPARALALLLPIADALAYAHSAGFVHRDVKPDNVFLARTPGTGAITPKLLDFGIARGPEGRDHKITNTGAAIGTPAYMAPEQVTGSAQLDARADQYAFAASLYEALSGALPHASENLHALLFARATQPPTPLSAHVADIDPAIEAAIMRALATDPAQRFDDMNALRAALAPATSAPAPATPTPATSAPATPTPATPTPATPAPATSALATSALATSAPATPAPATPATPVPATSAPTMAAAVPVAPSASAVAPRASRTWVMALSAVAACAAALAVSRGAAVRKASPAPAAATLPRAEVVTFTFDFSPPDARIELDGEDLGLRHAEVTRPKDGRRYQLRVSAPGHAPHAEVLAADGNVRVERALAPDRPPPPSSLPVPAMSNTDPQPPRPAPAPRHPRDRHHSPRIDRSYPGAGP